MLIKKKDQAQQKLNHIMVVPFTRRDHKVYYLAALTNGAQLDDKDSVKRYNLPASALAYEDMPTILNAKQE